MSIPAVDPFWMWMVAKIAGLVSAFVVINKYVIKPFRKNVLIKASEFYAKVNHISDELKPNGGSSLKDTIDRMKSILPRLQEKQRAFFSFENNAMWESDDKGSFIWVNKAFLDMLQRSPDDFLGSNWRSVICEKDRDRVVHEWLSAVNDHRDFSMKFCVSDAAGNEIQIESKAMRLVDSGGLFLGHLGISLRLDRPPPGCRWCRAIQELTNENYRLIKQQVDIQIKKP